MNDPSSPDDPGGLAAELAALRKTPVPAGLQDAVMERLHSERRWLGLVSRDWAFLLGSLGVFTVSVQAVLFYGVRLVAG